MKTVRDLLQAKKSPDVWSVPPDTLVYRALQLLNEKGIGALLVMEKGELVGIVSERDYARKVILHGKSSKELTVGEIMTSPVVCADPAWSAHDCMAMMSQWRVRHLPVIVDGQVVGVISIGDVVSAVVSEQASTIRNLEHYIASGS